MRAMPKRTLSCLAIALATCSLAAACVQSPLPRSFDRAAGTPVGTASNAPAPAASPRCYAIIATVDKLPEEIAVTSSLSTVIAAGMVKSLGTAYWNTLDGLAPATPQEAARAVIYTPVTIVPDQSIRGGPSGLDHAVIRGGVVGCSSVTYDDGLAVKPGARYLFFGIGPLSDSSGKVPERSVVFSAWPFATDGSVTTPKEGSQSIQALTSAIAAHPAVSSGQPLPFPSSTVVQPSPSDTYP